MQWRKNESEFTETFTVFDRNVVQRIYLNKSLSLMDMFCTALGELTWYECPIIFWFIPAPSFSLKCGLSCISSR